MPTFRVAKTKDYTVMSNTHFHDSRLSLKAKGLLSFMLSLPDDWDYTQKGLAATCRDGVDSIAAALAELESAGYLTRARARDNHGRVKDTIYTVYEVPQDVPAPDKHSNNKTTKKEAASKKHDNTSPRGVQKAAESTGIIDFSPKRENPVQVENVPSTEDENSPKRDFPVQVKNVPTEASDKSPKRDFPVLENPVQVPYKEIIKQNTKGSNTETKGFDIAMISHRFESFDPMRSDAMKRENDVRKAEHIDALRETVCGNIDYCALKQPPASNDDVMILNTIVDVMADTLYRCGTKDQIRVHGTYYPSQVVRDKLLALESDDIEYVILCLSENKTRVRDMRQYILAALFDARATKDSYFAMRVQHDQAKRQNTGSEVYGHDGL